MNRHEKGKRYNMVRSSKGLRKRTRHKLKKGLRDKFRPEAFIQEFKAGDKVIININPSSNKGAPNSRFNGKIGTVKAKRRGAFIVESYLGGKKKEIHVKPEHIKKMTE